MFVVMYAQIIIVGVVVLQYIPMIIHTVVFQGMKVVQIKVHIFE